jgi:uncharacterized peroxidase-related enzyme
LESPRAYGKKSVPGANLDQENVMPHIDLQNDFPGIVGLMYYKRSTGTAMADLAQAVLRGPSSLTPGERELIAARVSNLNECEFCWTSHAAAASELNPQMGDSLVPFIQGKAVDVVSPKLQALLRIAEKVQQSGRAVLSDDIKAAKSVGASDEDIHDTVLVAAAFCFFNRCVDGLGTKVPEDNSFYEESGKFLAKMGYKRPSFIGRFFMNRMVKR